MVAAPRYKIGDPYNVGGVWYYPARDLTYDETGIGSWYGDEFAGRLTANGEIFDGNWVEGHQNGSGQILFSNGNLLQGSWSNGKRNGEFLFEYPNGDKFSANFVNGERTNSWTQLN